MRVAVTRPRDRAAAVCAELRTRGLVPLVRSLVRVEAATESLAAVMDEMTADVEQGLETWLIFTSVEAVRALDLVRRELGRAWPAVRVACVGPATAAAAGRAGLSVTVVPSVYDGEALAAELMRQLDGERVRLQSSGNTVRCHWPRAEGAGMILKDVLTAAGCAVRDTVAYRALPDARGALRLQRDLREGAVNAVLFFSPSAVDAFVALIGMPAPGIVVGVIGGTTGARAREYGIDVHVQPAAHTITALADALRCYADDPSNRGPGR